MKYHSKCKWCKREFTNNSQGRANANLGNHIKGSHPEKHVPKHSKMKFIKEFPDFPEFGHTLIDGKSRSATPATLAPENRTSKVSKDDIAGLVELARYDGFKDDHYLEAGQSVPKSMKSKPEVAVNFCPCCGLNLRKMKALVRL